MNKLFVLGAASIILASCASGKIAQDNRKDFLAMKGEWSLTSVNYDSSKFSIKPFDEGADINCWIGSTWKLIPNNWSGSYTLNGAGACPTLTQPIKFEVKDGNHFVFKKIAQGTKAKHNIAGYSLYLVSRTNDYFSLKQSVPLGGEMVDVVYNFQKISK